MAIKQVTTSWKESGKPQQSLPKAARKPTLSCISVESRGKPQLWVLYADMPFAAKASNQTNMVAGQSWNQFSSINGTKSAVLTGENTLLIFATTNWSAANMNTIFFSWNINKEKLKRDQFPLRVHSRFTHNQRMISFTVLKLTTAERRLSERQSSETSNIRTHIFFVKIFSAFLLKKIQYTVKE